jgi:hypothetical protein
MVQGINLYLNMPYQGVSILPTKMGKCHPNVCTAETGSQLLTATAYSYSQVYVNATKVRESLHSICYEKSRNQVAYIWF